WSTEVLHTGLLVFLFVLRRRPPGPPLFPYTTLFRSRGLQDAQIGAMHPGAVAGDVDAILRQGILDAGLRAAYDNISGYTLGFYQDRKSTRLNSSHSQISYAVFCLKKKKNTEVPTTHK